MDISSYSNIGGRNENEDCICEVSQGKKRAFIVCDGLGGHGNGDVASRTACHVIGQNFYDCTCPSEQNVNEFYNNANTEILRVNAGRMDSKTTAVTLFIDHGSFIAAHIGDSRLYRFNNRVPIMRTTDHSVPQMEVMLGEITEAEIRSHPDRNRVLKVLGVEGQVNPTVFSGTIDPVFDAFLLCSDGFWEFVLEEEMQKTLAEARSAKEWLNRMRSIHDMRADTDCDNHSAIAIIIKRTSKRSPSYSLSV